MKKFTSYLPLNSKQRLDSHSVGVHQIKKYLLLGSALLLFTSVSTHAQEDPWKHEFSLGGEMLRYSYRERPQNGTVWMNLRSWQYGMHGSYRLTYDDAWWIQQELNVNYGLAQYKADIDPKCPNSSEPTVIFEARLISGYSFNFDDFSVAPYAGLGYRFKTDDATLIAHDGNRNPERYAHLPKVKRSNFLPYVALGVEGQYQINESWFLKGNVEFDKTFYGKLFTYDARSCPSPEEYKQGGFGIRSRLQFGKQFEKITLLFGPYVNFWKIKRSPTIKYRSWERTDAGGKLWGTSTATEPSNKTYEIGIIFTVKF